MVILKLKLVNGKAAYEASDAANGTVTADDDNYGTKVPK